MKKILEKIKNNKIVFLSFFISLLVIFVVYKLQSVSPFGDNSLLKIDFYHQYGPMLAELYDRIVGGKSLIYSFNTGLGLPFFRNFYNYLSSPINLIMFLFKRKDLLTSFSIIIAIKAALSSLTCTIYLKNKLKTKELFIVGLSILYAFSAYYTAYYWNIMWIDGMYMLPLVALGIERIINKNNALLYTFSLTIMIFINYFIGYMLCIFSVLYFILYLIIKIKDFNLRTILKRIGKFAISSLICGLLLAFEIIPMFNALLSTDATTGSVPESQYYAFTLIDFLKNHVTGVYSTVLASDISNAPNISCGILSIFLLILFIINKDIKINRKIIYIAFLIILIISFSVAPIDYIWHGFHVPNDLPYRYSFIYSFILITICAYAISKIRDISILKASIAFGISLCLLTFVWISKYNNISNNMIMINYLIITIYYLLFLLYKLFRNKKVLASFLFILVCSIESVVSINNNWNINQKINNYYNDYNDIYETIKNINDSEIFYRIEKNNNLTLNDGAWYDYYGQEMFSSMAYLKLAKLNNNLGVPGNNINSFYYKDNTPLYDLMFNIKYSIGKRENNTCYSEMVNSYSLGLYKSNCTNGLMFGVNNTIKNWKYNYTNPLEYQNDFILNSSNIENTFYRLTLLEKEKIYKEDNDLLIKYRYKNDFNNIYIYTTESTIDYIVINNNAYYDENANYSDINNKGDFDIYSYYSYNEPYVINETTTDEYIDIYVHYKSKYDIELDVYTINNDRFNDFYNYVSDKKIEITSFKEDEIKGEIVLDDNTTIYTSIPYDEGWKVYSNGIEINTFKIADSLLGFDLPKGENIIKLKYKPKYQDLGFLISGFTLLGIIVYFVIKKINHQD